MQPLNNPLFSVIIPTRNEAADIAVTLDKCAALNPPPVEILVVDDSSDNTPEIVAKYENHNVRLIHREKNSNGCCGARNLGLMEARGEIVVFLNADDRPEMDFLEKISNLYKTGVDYVIVKSQVINKTSIYGNYVHCTGEQWLNGSPKMEWSEGFSCRKEKAILVGGIPGDFPIPFCRDWMIGDALNKAGNKKLIDLSISMPHYCPDNIREYWHNQKWRGTFAPLNQYYMIKSPLSFTIMREFMKLGRTLILLCLVFPQIIEAIKLSAYSNRKYRDIPGLWFTSIVQKIALTAGNFEGLAKLIRYRSEV